MKKDLDEIVLHIGTHKTGTSTIQHFLRDNQEALKSQGYQLVEGISILNNTDDMTGIRVKPGKVKMLLDSALQDPRKAVMTNECFSWLDSAKSLRDFKRLLLKKAKSVRVIVYLRRQDQLVISQKQEGTRWPDNSIAYGHELQALPSSLTPVASRYLNYEENIRMWHNAFNGKITVRLFDRDRFINGCLVTDFMKQLGVDDLSDFKFGGNVNESCHRNLQLFLHEIRPYFPEGSQRHKVISPVVRHHLKGDGQKLLPSRHEAESFYAPFRDGNQRLAKFLGMEGEELFSNDFSQYPEEANNHPLSREDMIEVFSRATERLGKKIKNLTRRADLGERAADKLRDVALDIEETDMNKALELMKLASKLKPRGELIKQKVSEYSRSLNIPEDK